MASHPHTTKRLLEISDELTRLAHGRSTCSIDDIIDRLRRTRLLLMDLPFEIRMRIVCLSRSHRTWLPHFPHHPLFRGEEMDDYVKFTTNGLTANAHEWTHSLRRVVQKVYREIHKESCDDWIVLFHHAREQYTEDLRGDWILLPLVRSHVPNLRRFVELLLVCNANGDTVSLHTCRRYRHRDPLRKTRGRCHRDTYLPTWYIKKRVAWHAR